MSKLTICELVDELRKVLFGPNTTSLFLKGSGQQSQVAACLDTLGDAQFALDEYRSLKFISSQGREGRLYLYVYGALQAIFLQQDALEDICKSLGFPYQTNQNPNRKSLREIRNKIVHPTRFRRKKSETYYTISRFTMSVEGVEVWEHDRDGTQPQMMSVNIMELISDNECLIVEALNDLKTKLNDAIEVHKAKFRDEKLVDLFSPLNYRLEKIGAGATGSSGHADRQIAASAVDGVSKTLEKIREILSVRGHRIEAWSGIADVWDELQYPIEKLKAFYSDNDDGAKAPEQEAIGIFVWYVASRLDELREMCLEIDEFYSDNATT